MTVSHRAPSDRESAGRMRASPSRGFFEWLLGILGGVATFLGLFVLFADSDQYIGIGGDLSWRVGDISSAWAYGLLAGGLVLLILALGIIFFGRTTAGRTARTEPTNLIDLYWHAGIFLVVNAFLWVQDFAIGGGLDYAFWTTIPWGVGLAIHAIVLFSQRRTVSR